MDIALNQQRVWSLQREAARQSLFYADRGNTDLALFWKSIASLADRVASLPGLGKEPVDDTNIQHRRIQLSLLSTVNKSNNSPNHLEEK